MATLDDLTPEKTQDEFQAEILADLADPTVTGVTGGLPTTSWLVDSIPRIFTTVWARLARSFNDLVRAAASGVLLELSTGAWLTLLARNVYEVDRDLARSTVGLVQVTDASGAPGVYAVGSLTISDSAGRYYQNSAAATVPANSAHFLQFTAMAAGADGNVGNNSLTALVTASAGRTVNNPIPWITVFGTAAVATRGMVNLTSTGGGAILAGGVSITNGTWTYTNVAADTLVAGVAKAVLFEASIAGAQANVGNGEVTTVSVDPLGDITCANPAPSAGTWITSSGSDDQSDVSLRAECRAKWSTLGVGWTADAIEYLTLQAEPSATITRVKVESNPGGVAGLVGVTVATAAGVVSGPDVAVVQAYLDTNRTLTSDITVASVTVVTITISGVVYVPTAYLATAQAAAVRNLIALEGSVPVGGDADAANAVQLEDILSAIKAASYDATGINTNPASPLRIQLTAPTGDTALTAYQVPDFDYSGLTYTGV